MTSLNAEDYTALCRVVWPAELTPLTLDMDLENWRFQGFQFDPNVTVGLSQFKNGPCGILAAVQAVLLSDLLFKSSEWKDPSSPPSAATLQTVLIRTLSSVLCKVAESPFEHCQIVLKKNKDEIFSMESPEAFEVHSVPQDSVNAFLAHHILQFQDAGGVVLFLYSLVMTRGVTQVKRDMVVGIYDTSTLVSGSWGLCSQALVNLCVLGQALPGVDDDIMANYKGDVDIGLLTFEEVENMTFGSGYSPLTDSLKHPKLPIWIIHGGDHYTTLFGFKTDSLHKGAPKKAVSGGGSGMCVNDCGFHGNPATYGYCSACYKKVGGKPKPQVAPDGKCKGGCDFFGADAYMGYCSVCYKKLSPQEVEKLKQATAPVKGEKYSLIMYHYNGLPPAGPRLAEFTVVEAPQNTQVSNSNALPAVAMLIQRKWQGDETNGQWMYEVAQRFGDDFKPKGPAHETVPQEKWRCATCILQQQYGFNPPGSTQCETCTLPLNVCGQTVWVPYESLSFLMQKEVDSQYQAKIVSLLHIRWPFTTVSFGNHKPPTI